VPVPFLLGALALSLLLGLAGRRPNFPEPIRVIAFLLLGYLIGSTASADLFSNIGQWVPSVLAGILLIPAITFASGLVIHRMTDMNAAEAMLCSVPGSLPFVLAASEDRGLRTPIVLMFQTVRLLSLTFLLPFVLGLVSGETPQATGAAPLELSTGPTAAAPAEDPISQDQPLWLEMLILAGALGLAAGFALLASRLKVPAPTFIGPMMGVALVKILGVPLPDLPLWLLIGAQAALGWLMGARFDAIPLSDLRRMALAAAAGLATSLVVVFAACLVLVISTDLAFRPLLLALAPGAIETVTSIALEERIDPLFVSTHQIGRMLCIPLIVAAMLVVGRRLFARISPDEPEGR
jgi:hypothetical protein